jgi:hypothetical protein
MVVGVLALLGSVGAAYSSPLLQEKYSVFVEKMQAQGSQFPFYIESLHTDDEVRADFYVRLDRPIRSLADTLTRPRLRCEFMPLNLNIKACTYQAIGGDVELSLHVGRKFYQSPAESYLFRYRFQVIKKQADQFMVVLTADEGPLGTSDHVILAEAISVDHHSFLRVHLSYAPGFWSRLMRSLYLVTLGSDKMGFTVIERTSEGKPVYMHGLRSIAERNAMRYYLALRAFLETLALPAEKRFEARAECWFDLTEQYHEQLYELEKMDYLEAKHRERQNQLALQAKIDRRSESLLGDTHHIR